MNRMFKNKPPIFESGSKPEISLTMKRIVAWEDNGYEIKRSFYSEGEIEGGHEARISGIADDYWRGRDEIIDKKLRFHITITSDLSRLQFERGVIGGGTFHDEYVDVELILQPEQVRDIVHELRLTHNRVMHVAGFAISDKVFRATSFGFSGPQLAAH